MDGQTSHEASDILEDTARREVAPTLVKNESAVDTESPSIGTMGALCREEDSKLKMLYFYHTYTGGEFGCRIIFVHISLPLCVIFVGDKKFRHCCHFGHALK